MIIHRLCTKRDLAFSFLSYPQKTVVPKKQRYHRVQQVINRRKEQNQQADIHSLLIVDNLVIQSVERAKKVTGKKKETVDDFRNIVDKSKSFTGFDLFTGDNA